MPDLLRPWIMRPRTGTVEVITFLRRSGFLRWRIALIPLSESERLMDLVKFRGMVDGSLRSGHG